MVSEGPAMPVRQRFPRLRRRSRVTSTRLSEVLAELAADEAHERISVGDLLAAMRRRAIAALLFVFAFPNILPTPPGTSAVLGLPLVFLAAQMALGLRPWLPKFIAKRSMRRQDFAKFTDKASPWIAKAERLLRPRAEAFTGPPFEYVVGGICFVLAVVLLLPIPLGNMLPALAICVFALGTLERDGVWIIAGVVLSVVSVVVVWGVLFALLKSVLFIVSGYLGF